MRCACAHGLAAASLSVQAEDVPSAETLNVQVASLMLPRIVLVHGAASRAAPIASTCARRLVEVDRNKDTHVKHVRFSMRVQLSIPPGAHGPPAIHMVGNNQTVRRAHTLALSVHDLAPFARAHTPRAYASPAPTARALRMLPPSMLHSLVVGAE